MPGHQKTRGFIVETREAASPDNRRNVLTVVVGLVLGAILGLYVGWFAWPTQYTDADPTILQATFRYDYALMTAQTYAVDGDLPAAQRRLVTLGDNVQYEWYLATALDAVLAGRPEADLRYLAELARALGLAAPALAPYLGEGA